MNCNYCVCQRVDRKCSLKKCPYDEDSSTRVHAYWYKPTGMMPPEFTGRHRCSACDGFAMHDWKHYKERLTKFCPHCGAEMDNGKEE